MKRVAAFLLLVIAACAPVEEAKIATRELSIGDGAPARRHSTVAVRYAGWMSDEGAPFDSNLDVSAPMSFTVDAGEVIPGLEMGVKGMRPGGKHEIRIPGPLAYGPRGRLPAIPPNAALRFEVEVISVQPPRYTDLSTAQTAERAAKLIDVRTPEEWRETGVVPGSILLTAFDKDGRFRSDFLEKLTRAAAPGDEVVLICRSGNRSAMIAHMLTAQLGYTRVFNVEAGIKA